MMCERAYAEWLMHQRVPQQVNKPSASIEFIIFIIVNDDVDEFSQP
jgi:hypothetical protein